MLLLALGAVVPLLAANRYVYEQTSQTATYVKASESTASGGLLSPDGRIEAKTVFLESDPDDAPVKEVRIRGAKATSEGDLLCTGPRALTMAWSPDSKLLAVFDMWDVAATNVDVYEIAMGASGQINASLVLEVSGWFSVRYALIGWDLENRRILLFWHTSDKRPYLEGMIAMPIGRKPLPKVRPLQYEEDLHYEYDPATLPEFFKKNAVGGVPLEQEWRFH